MKDNQTGLTCESCSSHIIVYRNKNTVVYECSYCGAIPEDVNPIEDLSNE